MERQAILTCFTRKISTGAAHPDASQRDDDHGCESDEAGQQDEVIRRPVGPVEGNRVPLEAERKRGQRKTPLVTPTEGEQAGKEVPLRARLQRWTEMRRLAVGSAKDSLWERGFRGRPGLEALNA